MFGRLHFFPAITFAVLLLAGCNSGEKGLNPSSGLNGPANPIVSSPQIPNILQQNKLPGLSPQFALNPEWDAIRAAQAAHTPRLLSQPGIVGTGLGLGLDGSPALVVMTETAMSGIPSRLDGVPVRVMVTGKIVAFQEGFGASGNGKGKPGGGGGGGDGGGANTERGPGISCSGGNADPKVRFNLPVPIGVSLGHPSITAGTLGARVKNGAGQVFILSNNHVMANINNASIGDKELQPGPYDGGINPNDAVGTLTAFKAIVFCKNSALCPTANRIDAAIAATTAGDVGNSTPCGEYTPKNSVTAAAIGMAVKKYGRTTGLTSSTISATDVSVKVSYGTTKIALFTGQVVITSTSFSAGGDSGSLIVKADDNSPVALLFAGSSNSTIGNPIGEVLSHFGVSIDGI